MRLATITNWAYGATVALTLASGVTMLVAAGAQERERAAVALRDQLDHATSELDEDAARLSGLARQYAVSGALADVSAYDQEVRTLAQLEEQTSRIRDSGANAQELAALRHALKDAQLLQAQQATAMAARRAGDRDGALEIVFSPAYSRELDRILEDIARFQDRIDRRTDMAVQAAVGEAKVWQAASEVTLGATGVLFLFVLVFVFRNRVLRPVVRLSDVLNRLAAQDYEAAPPQLSQVDEIGDMAEAIRIFRETGLERQRLEHERDADMRLRDLLSRMTQRMQRCDSVQELQAVAQRFVPEIAPGLAGALYTLDASRNALVLAARWNGDIHSEPEFAPLACWALRRGSLHRPGGDGLDVPCGHLHASGERPADTVCLPLAGQNGTLGLLYFEAAPEGEGATPAVPYLRLLAENIGLALDNLRFRDSLREMAMADALTGLGNRRSLEAALEVELARAQREGGPISCIMGDIDRFKRINDEQGHDAGDTVLEAVGQALGSLSGVPHVFRYGGEEFLLLLPGADPDEAERIAEDVRALVAGLHIRHDGRDLAQVTISLGVASSPAHGAPGALVTAADAALLRAKQSGRNRVEMARSRSSEPAERKMG